MMGEMSGESQYWPTYENQCSTEVIIALLDVLLIVVYRFLLVHSVEIEVGVVGSYGSHEGAESILYTVCHSAISPGGATRPAHHFGSISIPDGGDSISAVLSIVVGQASKRR